MLHEAFSARRDETGRFASSIDDSAMTRWWRGEDCLFAISPHKQTVPFRPQSRLPGMRPRVVIEVNFVTA